MHVSDPQPQLLDGQYKMNIERKQHKKIGEKNKKNRT